MSKGNVLYDDGDFIPRTTTSGITASTTQSQGQGALTTEFNEVSTVANPSDTVTLPTAVTGRYIFIINNGANDLQMFPASGDDLGAGVNSSVTLQTGGWVAYSAYDATNWKEVVATDTSSFLTDSSSNTVTNKSLDAASNTITNIGSSEMEEGQEVTVKVSMSSAQIKLLGTEFTVISAPGANKTIKLTNIFCFNNYGTAAYVFGAGQNIEVHYNDKNGIGLGGINGDGGWAEAGQDQIYDFTPNSLGDEQLTNVVNKPIIFISGTNPYTNPTTGDGTYDFWVTYKIIETS